MYFRTNQVANDVLCGPRGSFCQSAITKDFLLKGAGIKNDKGRQELPHLCTEKTPKKGPVEIISRPRNISSNEFVPALSFCPCLQVRAVYKAEGQKEYNNIEKSTFGMKEKTQTNTDLRLSALTPPEKCCSRTYFQREQSNSWLLGNQVEPKFYGLCEKHENIAQDLQGSNVSTAIKQLNLSTETRKHCTTKLNVQAKAIGKNLTVPAKQDEIVEKEKRAIKPSQGEEACKSLERLDRGRSPKDRERKAVEIYGKKQGSGGGKKINALNCVLSRKSLLENETLEDKDYQEIDIEYLLKLKTVSRLSCMCDASAIDVVAKENTVKTETFLPPVYGSKWTLKHRYVSELSFNPPTPVLREYTRIAQARAVDFSDAASVGNQLYIM